MDILDLKSVIAVYKSRSFTQAAFDLDYSPSAISKHICKVENELGVKLFIRKPNIKSVQLTDIGEKIIEDIEFITQKYDAVLSQTSYYTEKETISLNIGFLPAFSNINEHAIIAKFLQTGDYEVSIHKEKSLNALCTKLETGMIDGFFFLNVGTQKKRISVMEKLIDMDFHILTIFNDRATVLIAGPDNPISKKEKVSLPELFNYPIIINSILKSTDLNKIRSTLIQRLLSERKNPKYSSELKDSLPHVVYVDFNNTNVLFQMLASGDYIMPAADYPLAFPGLVSVGIEGYEDIKVDGFFVYSRRTNKAIEAFRKCVKMASL